LQEELKYIFEKADGKPTCGQLEKLPYLSAVISEGLRLSFGVTTHLQRVSPEQIMMYKDWSIPPGVSIISVSSSGKFVGNRCLEPISNK
jgi:hypothetical protein